MIADAVLGPLERPRPIWQWTAIIVVWCVLWALWTGMFLILWIGNEIVWRLPFVAFSLCTWFNFKLLLNIRRDYLRRVAWEEAEEQDFYCAQSVYDGPQEFYPMGLDYTPRLDVQEATRQLLRDHPELEQRLQEIVAWERLHPPQNAYDGWSWFDTHTPGRLCTVLVSAAICDVVYQSRSSTQYRLSSRPDTEEALSNLRIVPAAPTSLDVTDLFRFVIGHDRAKMILTAAIESVKPVHVLLTGPVGTGKTLLLADVGALPGAEFYAGSTTTKAGLVNLLLDKHPRFLVIDEIDKMDHADMSPLLNLMEGGVVTQLQAKRQIRVTMDTRVIAGGNDPAKLTDPIRSRFAQVYIPPYSAAEFVQVAQAVLVQREGIGPEVAMLIATAVVPYSTDIRDAVRVGRLARGRAAKVEPTVASLFAGLPGRLPLTSFPTR